MCSILIRLPSKTMQSIKALSFLCVIVLLLVNAGCTDSEPECANDDSCITCGEITLNGYEGNLTMKCNLKAGIDIHDYDLRTENKDTNVKKNFGTSYMTMDGKSGNINLPLHHLDKAGNYTIIVEITFSNYHTYSANKSVTLTPPQQPPVLSVNVQGANETKLEETFNSSTATKVLDAEAGDQVTFTCNVSGGNPPVTDYIISCLPDNRCHDKANRSEPLVLTNLTSQHDGLKCFCEAFYVKNWYTNNRSTEITLKVKDNSSSDPQVSSTSSGDKHTVNFLLIIIVTSSVVGALFIAVIIGVIVFKVKGKRRGQMEASTQDGPTANQTAGFSQDWRNDRTLVMVDNSALYGQFTQQLKAAIKRPDETT